MGETLPEQVTAPGPRAGQAVRAARRARPIQAVRLAAAALALAAFALGPAAATAAYAALRQAPADPAGPAPISPLGHPRLCWEAWGNGSPITLEACERAQQGQQWTFTGNVLMNGNGYCLQNGGNTVAGNTVAGNTVAGNTVAGRQPGGRLYLSFSGQCGGTPSQQWSFTGQTSLVRNTRTGLCAYARGGLVPGAVIAGRRCGRGPGWDAWSQGASNVRLSAARHAAAPAAAPGSPGGPPQAGGHRVFSGRLVLSNAVRAMTAYGVLVSVRAPPGLRVTGLAAGGGLTGWACTARALTCRGNLAGGGRGEITVTGSVTGRPTADTVTMRAAVSRTNPAHRGRLTARVPVRVYTAAATATGQSGGHGPGTDHAVVFAIIAAGLLLAMGVVLAVVTRRRPGPPPLPPAYPDGSAPARGPAQGAQVDQAPAGRQTR